MRDALEPADGIVTFVGQEESFEEFRRFFEGDDVAERVSVSEMPPSLRLRTDGPLAEGLRSDLEAHPAVRAIVEPGSELAEQPDPDPRAGLTIVYLRADAGVAGREAINDVLADYEGRYFVGQEETLEEFRAFYIADSAQIESIAAHQMPPSWRIDLRGDQLDPNVVVALEASSFVREVIQPANE